MLGPRTERPVGEYLADAAEGLFAVPEPPPQQGGLMGKLNWAASIPGMLPIGTTNEFGKALGSKYGASVDIYPRKAPDAYGRKISELSELVIPEGQRGKGTGSKIMDELVRRADDEGVTLILDPDPSVRGGKRTKAGIKRLQEFYKRFGFLVNRGRRGDTTISAGMVRPPKPRPAE